MAELAALLQGLPRPEPGPFRVRRRRGALERLRKLAPIAVLWLGSYALITFPNPVGLWLLGHGALNLAVFAMSVFAVAFAVVYGRSLQLRQMLQSNSEGIVLLGSGRTDEAAVLYTQLARRARGRLPHHALFVGNRGVVAIQQGDHALGRSLLGEGRG